MTWPGTPIEYGELERRTLRDPDDRTYTLTSDERVPATLLDDLCNFLEAKLPVPLATLPETVAWLVTKCEYMSDQDQFGRRNLWLHPTDFETLRRGDCEDSATWSWVRIHRLGIESRLVMGKWQKTPHCWVAYRVREMWYLFETTAKDPKYRPAALDRTPGYSPKWSVDGDLRFYWHR